MMWGAGGAVGSMPPRDGFKRFPEMQMGSQNLREGINSAIIYGTK